MSRKAFTLVELMVVIIIIGFLVAILLPAYNGVRRRAKVAVISTEVYDLAQALITFKLIYGDYPPDFANSDRTEAMNEVKRFCTKAWPRIQYWPKDFQGATLPSQYNAGTALVFWLEGICKASGERIGFSADPTNPFDVDPAAAISGDQYADANICSSRQQKFTHFHTGRIKGTGPWAFWPATTTYQADLANAAYVTRQVAGYVYFRANNGGYDNKWFATDPADPATYHVLPLHGEDGLWLQAESFQLRCCGLDGLWWAMPSNTPKSMNTRWGVKAASGTDMNEENRDDLVYGVDGVLGDHIP